MAAGLLLLGALWQPTIVTATYADRTFETEGLDLCSAPTVAHMHDLWDGTPFWHIYIYIGGLSRACAQPNLTASWVSQVTSGAAPYYMTWGLVSIWLGPQAPCSGYSHVFSSNSTTSYGQGYQEAHDAYFAARDLGISSDVPIVYDLEAPLPGHSWTTTCLDAAKAFVRGWDNFLHFTPPQAAGLYGSSCASDLNSFATLSDPPDWIWGAYYNGNPSSSNLICVSSGNWSNHHRHKQYVANYTHTWNGTSFTYDKDCANGPVYGAADRLYDTECL